MALLVAPPTTDFAPALYRRLCNFDRRRVFSFNRLAAFARRPAIGLRGLDAVASLIADYRWAIDIEICVFPQEGLTNYPGTDELLVEGLKRGAKAVGGAPRYDTDGPTQITAEAQDAASGCSRALPGPPRRISNFKEIFPAKRLREVRRGRRQILSISQHSAEAPDVAFAGAEKEKAA
jgi:hypothetical protein